jgi:hypothetical protein
MIFAAITEPDAVQLAAFVGCLFFLAGGVNQVMGIMDRFKEKPPPSETYVSLKLCQKIHEEADRRITQAECAVDTLRRELRLERDEMIKSAEDRAVKLHDRINDILRAVSELKGKIESLKQ